MVSRVPKTFVVAAIAGLSLTYLANGAGLTTLLQPLDAHFTRCDAPTGWSVPGHGLIEASTLLDQVAGNAAVLLGERHDQAAHHYWQLETLRALHERRPELVLALEMFPRRVQPVLDAWVRGELSEDEFLQQSDWDTVWRFDPELYMDIFRFAREHGIPMRAVNVDSGFTRSVSQAGFDATAESLREGVSRPAAPHPQYKQWLEGIYSLHPHPAHTDDDEAARQALANFIDAQLVWDRSMAQGISDALKEHPGALVVGLIGSGHLIHGYGVPHQLDDLGIGEHATLLPWDETHDCAELVAGLADAVFNTDQFQSALQPGKPVI